MQRYEKRLKPQKNIFTHHQNHNDTIKNEESLYLIVRQQF